jgi:nucleoside-diphosphate-sugar epimerase
LRYLLTGVAGFIGSHLAERLLAQGDSVIGVDCFTDYYPRWIKEKNMAKLAEKPNFEFIEANLKDIELKPLLGRVNNIFHLAAQAGVRSSWGKDFDHYLENNIKVTQRILESMRDYPELKLVFASTSSVYGNTDQYPTPENALKRPFSPYGVTKFACESLCYLYFKNFEVKTTMLRFFTVFGSRQRPDMAFHKFIRAVLRGDPIGIYGDGSQTRDYTYIQDIVTGIVSAMEKGKVGEAYNLGGGHQTQLMDAVNLIFELCGKKTEIKYQASQKGDVQETLADTTKARTELGYDPKGSVELGLKEEINWVKSILEKE